MCNDHVNAEAPLPGAQCWTASFTWPHSWRICVIFHVTVSAATLADVWCHEVMVYHRSNFAAVLLNDRDWLGRDCWTVGCYRVLDVTSVLLWLSYQDFFYTTSYCKGDLFIIQMYVSCSWDIAHMSVNSSFQSVVRFWVLISNAGAEFWSIVPWHLWVYFAIKTLHITLQHKFWPRIPR